MSSSQAASIVEASPAACSSSCCGHLPASVTPQGAEPKILYEHCVRPSGVRGNSSGRKRRLSPSPMVSCMSYAEAVVGATAATCSVGATSDKTTQTTAPTPTPTPQLEAHLESDDLEGGRQSNEEVHNTTVEDAGEASERDWSSDETPAVAAVTAAAAVDDDEAAASADDAASLSKWQPVGCGLQLSELPFRRLSVPTPLQPPSQRRLLLKSKRKSRRSSLSSATDTAARMVSLRQRHSALVPKRLQQQQQQQNDDEAQQQQQQQQQQPQYHMPLLEWSPFATLDQHQQQQPHLCAINRPVRRAIRELSKLILCGILLVLCGNLLLGAGIVLQWNTAGVTYDAGVGRPGREIRAAMDDDFADYVYGAPGVIGHRLY